jgi:hypothetical protein
MNEILPSVRFHADSPRPIGFVTELTDNHVTAAGRALEELAACFQGAENAAVEVRVCLCSTRYVPGLPEKLYSFHIISFDANGEPLDDEIAASQEIFCAFVINQPIEVQREAAVLFLYSLVFRQTALRASDADLSKPDLIAAEAEERARREFSDRIRGGWRDAARSLTARAHHDGITLIVRYQIDPFPAREDIVRRMPALRNTYNSLAEAREFIDKVVSMIGGRDPRVSAPGESEEVRAFVQRKLVELGVRHYMTQTLRDAEVLGNGYLVTPTTGDAAPYALRPEQVEVRLDGQFVVNNNGSKIVDGNVLHVKGVEQFTSPYGFSVLEVVLPEWIARRRLDRVLQQVKLLGAKTVNPIALGYQEELEKLVERHRTDSDERLSKLLWYPRDWLPDAVSGLYFPGQERM